MDLKIWLTVDGLSKVLEISTPYPLDSHLPRSLFEAFTQKIQQCPHPWRQVTAARVKGVHGSLDRLPLREHQAQASRRQVGVHVPDRLEDDTVAIDRPLAGECSIIGFTRRLQRHLEQHRLLPTVQAPFAGPA